MKFKLEALFGNSEESVELRKKLNSKAYNPHKPKRRKGMFGWGRKAKNKLVELNKSEHRPVARAIVAAGVYIAAADGNIEDSEIATLRSVIANNKTLAPFVPEANDWTNEFTALIKNSPRTAKLEILRVVEAVRNDREWAQNVLVAAMDIADSNGSIGEEETVAIVRIAEVLGLDPKDYDL